MSKQLRKIRVGVVGVGMGKAHAKAYRQDANCQVVALCDMDKSRLDAAADDLAVDKRYTDAQQMFESGEIDVVSIATPNATHAPLSIAAMKAGLHVLCEKPMATNTVEAKQMIAVAEAEKRKLAIHFNHRMNPSIMAFRRYAEAGDFGEIYFARTIWHRRKGIPARPTFLKMANSGGGAMIDLGVHMLDQTLFVMGYPAVKSVSAQTYTKFGEKDAPGMGMDVDDFSVALVRLANGATLELEISWASHHDHPEQTVVQLYGTGGGAKRRVETYQEVECTVHRREHRSLVSATLIQPMPIAHNVQTDFLEAIREDREPLCAARHGMIVMQVLDAIYQSAREGREVAVG